MNLLNFSNSIYNQSLNHMQKSVHPFLHILSLVSAGIGARSANQSFPVQP